MVSFPTHFIASLLSPLGYGLLEIGKSNLELFLKKITEHFETSDLVSQALQSAYSKSIETIQIALSGFSFYHSKAIQEFSQQFQQEILLPFLKQTGKGDEFIQECRQQLRCLQKISITQDICYSELASCIAGFVCKEAEKYEKNSQNAQRDFIEWVNAFFQKDSSALAELLEYRNVLKEAMQMHFGMAIQKNEELFRAFWLMNQKGLSYQIEKIQEDIQIAKTKKDREFFDTLQEQNLLLQRIQSQIEFGVNYIPQDIYALLQKQGEQSSCWQKNILQNFQEIEDFIKNEFQKFDNSLTSIKEELSGMNASFQRIASQPRSTHYHQEIHVYQVIQEKPCSIEIPHEKIESIVIVGETKRGKSSLINAILGMQLLPVSSRNLFSLVQSVKWGKSYCAKLYLSEHASHFSTLPAKAYNGLPYMEFLQEELNTSLFYNDSYNNISPYQKLEIEYPCPMLQKGIQFIELPSYTEFSLEKFWKIPDMSSFLWNAREVWQLLSYNPCLTAADRSFFQSFQELYPGKKIRQIVNFIDQIPYNERTGILEFCQKKLSQPYLVSSKQALEAKVQDNKKQLAFSDIAKLESILC